MKNKLTYIVLTALVLQAGVFSFAFADDAAVVPPAVASGSATAVEPAIITKIREAKNLLGTVDLNHQLAATYKVAKKKKVLTGYKLQSKDVVLAVLDPATNQISLVKGTQSGKKMSFSDPNVNVQLVTFNGVNSRYQVNSPAGGVVVAVKYLLSNAELGGQQNIENGLEPVVYVPYSANLGSPEVYAYGANYLTNIINSVAQDLQGIQSASIPGKTVVEAIPPSMIKALIYAEHTSYAPSNPNDAQNSFNQLNVLFAANEGDTYKYSVSNDGYYSRGISQFIEPTYESLVQRHPEAGLIADYKTAMEDHRNSIKAMYLLIDDYAGAVRVKAPDGFTSGRVFDYGAAAYNGGTTRVAKAVENFGDNWNTDLNAQVSGLKNQAVSLNSKIKSLKAKIKKTKETAAKAQMQSDLASAQSQVSSVNDQISKIQSSTLRSGTINYLNKIYGVIQYFNGQQA